MESPDLSKVIRLLGAAQEAAAMPAATPVGRRSIRVLYWDLRDEARAAVPAELHGEFDALFPAGDSSERIRALAGWLNGIVQHATLDQRIKADAEALAKERAKTDRGVGFSAPSE